MRFRGLFGQPRGFWTGRECLRGGPRVLLLLFCCWVESEAPARKRLGEVELGRSTQGRVQGGCRGPATVGEAYRGGIVAIATWLWVFPRTQTKGGCCKGIGRSKVNAVEGCRMQPRSQARKKGAYQTATIVAGSAGISRD